MSLAVSDCLASHVVRVLDEERAHHHPPDALFAVFRESTQQGKFCGMATAHDIALHPDWIFADLTEHRPALTLPPSAPVETALGLLDMHDGEAVAVLEKDGRFIGAVTRASMLRALLQESSRMRTLVEADRQQLAAWSQRLSDLYDASRTLLGVLAHSVIEVDLLQAGIEALARLLQARYGAVSIVNDTGELRDFVHTGVGPEVAARIGHYPEGKGVLGAVIRENAAIRLEDMSVDPRHEGFPAGHPPMKSLLAVPISHLEHVYGRIYLCNKLNDEPFTADDEILAMSFANTLALALDNAREMQEIRHQREQLDYMAHFDALTGLPNRTLLRDRASQARARAQRNKSKVALLFIDLDNFKQVNDSLGHAAGDGLLKNVAERILGSVRQGDTFARLGGDEFVMLLPDLQDVQDAAIVAQKLLAALEKPFDIQVQEIYIGASIGISIYPMDADSMDALLTNADTAMYHAKALGKNNYQFFSSSMSKKAQRHTRMEARLRRALEREELILHYQPQVHIASARIIGMESLLRWDNPKLGLVAPSEFISLAEDSGLIVPIGEWVLRAATLQAKKWLDAGCPTRIAVNLSAIQFHRGGLVDTVTQALAHSGLPPNLLELEITENVLMLNEEKAIATLKQLTRLGTRFSMDDFGTGYSSLSFLQRFPISTLKIDNTFIQDLPSNANDAAIVSAITAMAARLGLNVLAEGVETSQQLAYLRAQRCDYAQGYHLYPPLTAIEATETLLQKPLVALPQDDAINAAVATSTQPGTTDI